jgi:NADH-quinone oxidoreductase subunit H
LPRLRIDQVMQTCLKYLLPLSCVLLLGVSFWQLLMPTLGRLLFSITLAAVCLAGLAWLVVKVCSAVSPRLPFQDDKVTR